MATPIDAMYEEMGALQQCIADLSSVPADKQVEFQTQAMLHGLNGVMQGLAAINDQLQELRDDPPRVSVRY